MPTVRVKEHEPFEVALRRFRRSCEKAGVFAEVRRREFYEKPTSVRKRKAAAGEKREHKKRVRVIVRGVRVPPVVRKKIDDKKKRPHRR